MLAGNERPGRPTRNGPVRRALAAGHACRPCRPGTRRADRRRRAADLPDRHVRAGRQSAGHAAARSTRVPATPRGHGSRRRLPHSRERATAWPLRAARPRQRRSPRWHSPANGSCASTTCMAAPSATSSGCCATWASSPATTTSPADPTGELDRALDEHTRLVWLETPTNPHLRVDRHRRHRAASRSSYRRPRRAAHPGRRQHLRLADLATPARARRGHRLPLGDEVPRRPLRHHQRRAGHLARRSARAPQVPAERDRRRAGTVRLLPRAAWHSHPGPARRAAHGQRAAGGRGAGRDGTTSSSVNYPGLTTGQHAHAQADLAARQMRYCGGMLSFVPAPRDGRSAAERARRCVEGTRIFSLAESLGGVESLVEIPAVMTHGSVANSPLEVSLALVRLVGGHRGRRRPGRRHQSGPRPGLTGHRLQKPRRAVDRWQTIIEPFRIHSVEPIRMTTVGRTRGGPRKRLATTSSTSTPMT